MTRRGEEPAMGEPIEARQETLVVCFDADGHIVHANGEALRRFGLTRREQLIGQSIARIVADDPGASARLLAWMAALPAPDAHLRIEATLAAGDGKSIAVEWFVYCLGDNSIAPCVPFQAIGIDVSERRRIRQRLHLFSQLADQTPFGILITDRSGVIEYANAALCEISGYPVDELIGEMPRLFASAETAPDVFAQLWQTISDGRSWSGDLVNRRRDGDSYWTHLDIAPVLDEAGAISHYFSIFHDLSEKRAFVRQIEYLSSFDQLTGLPNRISFINLLEAATLRARSERRGLVLAYLDLDQFKGFNESLGQIQGDQILLEVTRRIQLAIRRDDILARIGSDEFALLLAQEQAPTEAVERVMRAIQQPIPSGEGVVSITCSIGTSRFPEECETGDQLLANAEAAMFAAKQDGRDNWKQYVPGMIEPRTGRADLLGQLRKVIENGELMLHYQPQLSLASGEIIGVEALVRWNHPQRGLVPPGQFIPILEESGLIVPISEWIVGEACRQAQDWQSDDLPAVKVGVNLSARHFRCTDLPEKIAAILGHSGLAARWLELELTESVMMHDAASAIRIVDRLKEIGVRLSLDDFGTGYSSLAYLSRFSIDSLKIDQSFVRDITTNAVNASIATATIAMAHKLGKSVIAEGVETEGQMSFLRRHECDEMQGFLFSRPVPPAEIAALLGRGARLRVRGDDEEMQRDRILLVDDEPNILNALRRLLRREGYRILTAESAAQGLEILARESVHVIVSDQRMPEMTGTEFLGKVKEMYPQTVRIVLSGYSDISSVTEAINRGAIYKYFSKPWDDERLKEDIRIAFRYYRETFGSATAVNDSRTTRG